MTAVKKWAIVGFSVAWLIWELIGGFRLVPGVWPLTQIIETYVPAPIIVLAVGTLVAWLPRHFTATRGKAMPGTDLLNPQPAREPVLAVGTWTAAGATVVVLLTMFGLHLSPDQSQAVIAMVAVLAPLITAAVARHRVFSPATVAALVKVPTGPVNSPTGSTPPAA